MNHTPPGSDTPRGAAGLFGPTLWSVVRRAKDDSRTALNTLCTLYRDPLVVFLRAKGYPRSDAEDLVQGLFQNLLRRDFLRNVSSTGGKFRTFLLNALDHHLHDEYDRGQARKRGGGKAPLSLDEVDEEGNLVHEPADQADPPDRVYLKKWALTILDNALRRVREECVHQGHERLFEELEPKLFADKQSHSHEEIARRLGTTAGAVKVAAHRIRKRLQFVIRDEIRQTVENEADWEEECTDLMGVLAS
jgi:RNA polymerase sigma factor (sigma-70 family)